MNQKCIQEDLALPLPGYLKKENENLNKPKEVVVETLRETGISKEEITNNIDKLLKILKTDKNNTQNTIIKLKSHSFKEKFILKEK